MSSGPESSEFGDDESPKMDPGLMGPAGSIPEDRPAPEDVAPGSASQPVSPTRGLSPVPPAPPTKAPTKAGSSGSGSLQLEDNEQKSSPEKTSSEDGLTFEVNDPNAQVEQVPMVASRPQSLTSPREAAKLPPRKSPPDTADLTQQVATMGVKSPSSPEKSPKGEGSSSQNYPAVGSEVMLAGLQSKPELNGQRGPIVSVHPEKGRVAVKVPGKAEPVLVKPENVLERG